MFREIDDFFQRFGGMPYQRATRSHYIHDRCEYLRRELGPARRVLDVGCGSGMAYRYIASKVERYKGIDLNATRLTHRYPEAEFNDVDLDSDWSFSGFDLAWCSEVLEHLIDDFGVLRKITNCVDPGGRIIVTMPSFDMLTNAADRVPESTTISATQDGGHVRVGYTRDSIIKLVENAGNLEVEKFVGLTPASWITEYIRLRAPQIVKATLNPIYAIRRGYEEEPKSMTGYASIGAVLRVKKTHSDSLGSPSYRTQKNMLSRYQC